MGARSRLHRSVPTLIVFAPTFFGIALDLAMRGRSILGLSARGQIGYLASSFVGVGMWFATLYVAARTARRAWPKTGGGSRGAELAFAAIFAVGVFPFAVVGYGVQAFYVSVFDTYITRDTLRLGAAFHGTVLSWLSAWGMKLLPAVAIALVFTVGLALLVRRHAGGIARTNALVPAGALVVAGVVGFRDVLVSTEWLQSPDAALQSALLGLLHDVFSPRPKQGLTYRAPVEIPLLPPSPRRPNLLLVITESVRADLLCAEKTPSCTSTYLDDVIGDRVGLRRMTSQSSGTISSCMSLWTGLGPDVDLRVAHTTPLVWEVARAAGYRTAYIASQDLRAFGLGPYLANASIDVRMTAEDFGGVEEIHLGCPDERATARAVTFAREETTPWLAVLHLSNTHFPYRVERDLQPFSPHDDSPFGPNVVALQNHIKNSVLLQERTIASMYRSLRALPAFDDTVTLFVSDHGDQLREHGALFHLNSLFDEELRVPAWVVAGPNALSNEQRSALAGYRDRRVFPEDVNATLLDLLGAFDARATFPNGERLRGRSLVRPGGRADDEPIVSLSTASGVWFDDQPVFGVMSGEWKVLGTEGHGWVCYDLAADPRETKRLEGEDCPPSLVDVARRRFPQVPRR